jgi:excisionase family DNA binding protein
MNLRVCNPTLQVESAADERNPHSGFQFGRDESACVQYLLVTWFSNHLLAFNAAFSANAQPYRGVLGMSADRSSIDVMAEFGVLQAHEVAELLKLRQSTVLDLSRRGILPAFKIGKHWRYRRAHLIEWIANRGEAA